MADVIRQRPISLLTRQRVERFCIGMFFIWVANVWLFPVDSQMAITLLKPYGGFALAAGFCAGFMLAALALARGRLVFNLDDRICLAVLAVLAVSAFLNFNTASDLFFFPSMLVFLLACISMRQSETDAAAIIRTLLRWTLIASVVLALAWPQFGLMGGAHEGRWRGLLLHKNQLGELAAYFLVLTMFAQTGARGLGRLADVALAVLVLFHCESAAAIAASLLAVAVSGTLRARQRFGLPAALFGAACVVASGTILIAQVEGGVLALLNRDASFSGRTLIWEYFISVAAQQPLLGWGHGSIVISGQHLAIARELIWDQLRSAHSGYLTLALNGGLFALVPFVLMLALAALRDVADSARHMQLGVLVTFAAISSLETVSGFGICIGLMLYLTTRKGVA